MHLASRFGDHIRSPIPPRARVSSRVKERGGPRSSWHHFSVVLASRVMALQGPIGARFRQRPLLRAVPVSLAKSRR